MLLIYIDQYCLSFYATNLIKNFHILTMSPYINGYVYFINNIGLFRTGTLSTKTALEIIYKKPCYHIDEMFKNDQLDFWDAALDDVTSADFDKVFSGYAACVDFPAAKFWKDILKAYPNAKVVMTTRSAESWFNSCKDTVFTGNPHSPYQSFGQWILNFVSPFHMRVGALTVKLAEKDFLVDGDYSKENCIRVFENWKQDVIDSCPKDKLLVFDVKHGWEPLCKFLNVPIPDVPFPNVNETASFKKATRRDNMIGTSIFVAFLAIVISLALIFLPPVLDSLLSDPLIAQYLDGGKK
jgi:hypothetical protein